MSFRKILYWLLVSVPFIIILIFYIIHFKYASNIPQLDDYDAVIYFISNFLDADTFFSKLKLLLSQHREHRYFFPRLFLLLQFAITGKSNFIHILFMGHAALIGVYFVILKSANLLSLSGKNLNKLLLIIFITGVFFQLQYAEGSIWAIAAFFTYWGLLFSFTSLYFLNSGIRFSLSIAITLAVLASFTAGSGLLTFISGAVIIFLNKKFSKSFFLWCFSGIVIFVLYFHNYITPSDQTPLNAVLIQKPVQLVIFFFSYLGSPFKQISLFGILPLAAGLVIFLSFVFLFIKKYYKKNPAVFAITLYLILTIAANSVARLDVGFIPRYNIFTAMIIILLVISFVELNSEKIRTSHLALLAVLGIVFNIHAFHKNYDDIIRTKNILTQGIILSKAGNYSLAAYPDSSNAKKLILLGKEKNIYDIPEYSYKEFLEENIDVSDAKESGNIINEFNSYNNNDTSLYINGFISLKDKSDLNSEVYLFLKSDQYTFVFKPNPIRRKELTFKNASLDENKLGYSFVILKYGMNFPKGVYKLGFLILGDGVNDLLYADDEIVF